MTEGFDWKTSKISLDKTKITPEDMDLFLDVLPREFIKKNQDFLRQSRFVREKKGIFSVDDFEKQFNLTGSFRVGSLEELGEAKDFFTQKSGRFFTKDSGSVSEYLLRGPRYICAIDPNLSIRQKLKILLEDAFDSINFLKRQKLSKEGQFKNISPVLDYFKNTVVTLLNSFIHNEKKGFYNLDNEDYQSEKTKLIELVRKISFAYYLSLLDSLDQDSLDYILGDEVASIIDSVSSKIKDDFEKHKFPNDALARPESSHPLVILGSVEIILSSHPEAETVVGMQAGATEVACVLTEAHRYFLNTPCDVILLPISNHTVKKFNGDSVPGGSTLSEFILAEQLKLNGKNVIIIDDNASTGNTIEKARDAIVGVTKPIQIVSSVVEADLIRSSIDKDSKKRTNVAHPLLYSLSVSVLPVSKHIWAKHDLKEIMEINQLIKFYKDKIKTAQTPSEVMMYEVFIDDLENPTERVLEETKPEKRIEKFQGTYLSNFYSVPVIYDEVSYPSVEHAYQGLKFSKEALQGLSQEQKNELEEILKQKGYARKVEDFSTIFTDSTIPSGVTKVVATKLKEWGFVRKDWDDVRIEIMINLLIQKFNVPELRERLKNTGGMYLIEGNTWEDTLWGICEGTGKNMLGRIMMNIRSKIY